VAVVAAQAEYFSCTTVRKFFCFRTGTAGTEVSSRTRLGLAW